MEVFNLNINELSRDTKNCNRLLKSLVIGNFAIPATLKRESPYFVKSKRKVNFSRPYSGERCVRRKFARGDERRDQRPRIVPRIVCSALVWRKVSIPIVSSLAVSPSRVVCTSINGCETTMRKCTWYSSRTRRPASLNFNITKSCNLASKLPGALTSSAQFIKITMKLLLREV